MNTNHIHVALLGDSIFDNASYVARGQTVLDHVRRRLGEAAGASLMARDGDVAADVFEQIEDIPSMATHIALSVGGNNALGALPATCLDATSVEDALRQLAPIREGFLREYHALVGRLTSLGKPLAVCTIYEHVSWLGAAHRTALALFNDAITRVALAAGATIIDLREICTEPGDYSVQSPIEPSEAGGNKIASAICDWIQRG
jgi:hypothetical protein